MMRDVYLHGHLASFVGPQLSLDCETAGEAVRAIGFQAPKFIDALAEGHYVVIRGDAIEKGVSLDLDQIMNFKLGQAGVHFVPVPEGSGGGSGSDTGAWIKIIAGAAIVGAAIFMSGGVLTTGIGFMGLTYGNMAFVGLTLALLGASKLLADPSEDKEKTSFALSGPMNTYGQGNPVPLIYGETMAGSVTISSAPEISPLGTYELSDWIIVYQEGWNNPATSLVLESLRVRVMAEDSLNCGGTNSNTQTVELRKTITISDRPWMLSVGALAGSVELQNGGYERLNVNIDGQLLLTSNSRGQGLGCAMGDPDFIDYGPKELAPGEHTLVVYFSTNDALYHTDAFYDITLKLEPK